MSDRRMHIEHIMGKLGSFLLFLGVFIPIVSVSNVGSRSLIALGLDGIIIAFLLVMLALSSVYIVFKNTLNQLWFTGLGSLLLITTTFWRTQLIVQDIKTKDNPLRGLAEIALNSLQLEWGWKVLFAGAFLIIAAALISHLPKGTHDPASSAEA